MEFFSSAEARLVRPVPLLIPRCDRCKLDKAGCVTPKMRVDGEGRRGILVVSDYPGKEEDREGRPFVGWSGRFLAAELNKLGVDLRRDCWLTNAQICHDPDKRAPKTVVEDCRPNLLRAVEDLNPEVILLLGTSAILSLISHLWKPDIGKVSIWPGQRIPAHKPNSWICPSWNPAHVLRDKDDTVTAGMFRRHLADAVALDGRPWPDGPPDYESRVEVIHDPARAAERIRRYTSGIIAFDYETTTLKPDGPDAEIVCCSVCWEGRETIAFPWHGPVIPAMRDLLENREVGKVGQNAKFEHRWSKARHGITVRGWVWDGMLAAHMLDPRSGVTGLKFNAFTRLGQKDYNHHIEPFLDPGKEKGGNARNRILDIKLDLVLKYCALDSLLEYEVAQHQMREMGVELGT